MSIARWVVWLVLGLMVATARAGMVIEVVEDPRYFERQQQVIFPHAEVKLVTFEFESVGGDERGKQRAKQLHDQFLAKIHDLHGGAIITFVTPPGQKIDNYRAKAEQIAKQQQAQMVLWGRILVERSGTPLISARLMLLEPPPGVSADLRHLANMGEGGAPVEVKGVIDAPVAQMRVDFNTLENDVTTLAHFLSGLARYYKGAAREGEQARRWLRSSIDDFRAYVDTVDEKQDRAALAQARLYLARAYLRLAEADSAQSSRWLTQARDHAEEAARLNPYDAGVATVLAVVTIEQGVDSAVTRAHLMRAVGLAPTDANVRINLAVFESAAGQVSEALRQLDNASFVQRAINQAPLPSVQMLREQLKPFEKTPP